MSLGLKPSANSRKRLAPGSDARNAFNASAPLVADDSTVGPRVVRKTFLQIFPQLRADAGLNDRASLATLLLAAGLLLSWIPFGFVIGNRRTK